MRTTWSSLSNGTLWVWEPLPGMDPSLGEEALWTASAAYAAAKQTGLSETMSQQEAEKVAFQVQYAVSYSSSKTSQIAGKHKQSK
jgi:hypothetical protein